MKTEFLKQMDVILHDHEDSKVFVLATTNLPWELDIAALRRFEKRMLVGLPDEKARADMFKLFAGKDENDKHLLSKTERKRLASLTEGYSSSDISNIIKDSKFAPIRRVQEATHFKPQLSGSITTLVPCGENEQGAMQMRWTEAKPSQQVAPGHCVQSDFEAAIQSTKPMVSSAIINMYNKFAARYGHGNVLGAALRAGKEEKDRISESQKEEQLNSHMYL